MSASSIVVLVVVIALAALAVWRNLKKGAPCECGGQGASCCCARCHCNEGR